MGARPKSFIASSFGGFLLPLERVNEPARAAADIFVRWIWRRHNFREVRNKLR